MTDKITFSTFLGLEVEVLKDGYCRTRLTKRPEFLNQGGTIHGGLYAAVADHTVGTAAGSIVRKDQRVRTAEYKLNILRPGDCDALLTEGNIVKAGRRLIIGEGKVYGQREGQENVLLAVSLFTFAVLNE